MAQKKETMMYQDEITALLRTTNRAGIGDLIDRLLIDGRFFYSPASTKFHGCYPGGLAAHSLGVYKLLCQYGAWNLDAVTGYGQEPLPITSETFIIAALLHDVCKIGAYIGEEKPYKWNRQQPSGHAWLSLNRITRYIELTELEALMIKYHMGVYGLHEYDEKSGEYPLRGDDQLSKEERRGKSLANAWYHNPIVKIMYFCDELETLQAKQAELNDGKEESQKEGSNEG